MANCHLQMGMAEDPGTPSMHHLLPIRKAMFIRAGRSKNTYSNDSILAMQKLFSKVKTTDAFQRIRRNRTRRLWKMNMNRATTDLRTDRNRGSYMRLMILNYLFFDMIIYHFVYPRCTQPWLIRCLTREAMLSNCFLVFQNQTPN